MIKKVLRISKYLQFEDSIEYQRMLAGIRVFFSLFKRRGFLDIFLVLILISPIFVIVSIFANIEKNQSIFVSINNGLSLSFVFIIIMILILIFLTLIQFEFKIIKGIKIFFKHPISLLITSFTIILLPSTILQGYTSIGETIRAVSISLLFIFILALSVSISFLKPESLLSYATEKLLKTNEEKKKWFLKSSYYIQYYYSIVTYYKIITINFKSNYKDDILIKTKSQLIPLLGSLGVTNKSQDKEKTIEILKSLSCIDAVENPSEFLSIMKNIEDDLLNQISCEEKQKIIEIFKDKTRKEKTKEILLYIVSTISIIGTLVNIFSDKIVSFILKLFS
jgi:hypothetical protein